MRVLWTLLKVIIGLAIAIPLGIIVLGTMLGILGAAIALAAFALKLACIAFVGYGAYRILRHVLWPSPMPGGTARPELAGADAHGDRYYAAAMRELDADLGPSSRG